MSLRRRFLGVYGGGIPRAPGLLLALLTVVPPLAAQSGAPGGTWPVWGGDAGATRYTALDRIDADNVRDLEVVWRWRMDGEDLPPEPRSQTVPLMVDGVLYLTAGLDRAVVALDAATGTTLWTWHPGEGVRAERAPRRNSGRGVASWSADGERRIVTITPGFHLVALDAATGRPVPGFGREGVVDLMEGLRVPPGVDPVGMIGNSSPPVIANDVIIVGPAFQTGFRPPSMANVKGDIRGFDVRTGRELWAFRTIPEPGEPGSETWEEGSAAWTGNAGVWPPFTADPDLGLVYLPVEAPTSDYYGGHRPGANLYSSSLVALHTRTGELAWHFQTIHHDIWDYDMPSAPILVDVDVAGQGRRRLVIALTKQGWAWVFDRETGTPIWPIEERPVPASDVPGEWTSPTQPFPTRPAPFDRQGLSEDDLIDFTPALRARALEAVRGYRLGPLYTPPSVLAADSSNLGTILVPGALGAAAWEGGAVDPETGILYVGSATTATAAALAPDPSATDMRFIQSSAARTPTVDGLPLFKPPYGRITAIDLTTGEHVWMIPNGATPRSVAEHPALAGLALPPTGKSTRAGTLVTRTLLFAGEGWGGDPVLRAIDKSTGAVLHTVTLPGTQNGHPISYLANGRQFVVLSVGGPGQVPELVALALRARE
ncbi:MAG: PQQ-binding-like beta-propeller repeat protein [Gemmatimonadota bacterium]|nr:PQQ-binding-like beta-propeller repeat protein [Gemmatimonadota bacterium]